MKILKSIRTVEVNGKEIIKHRKSLPYNQKYLAKLLRISSQYLCDIEIRKKTVPYKLYRKILKVLDIDE